MLPNHLCLLFHCLKDENTEEPSVYPEFFVEINKVRELIIQLKELGYSFVLPHEIGNEEKTCSFTFDDGYQNNKLFLKLAEEFQIPFISFFNSYNISEQVPYIWDIHATNKTDWSVLKDDYKNLYSRLSSDDYASLANGPHRPFTMDEVKEFAKSEFCYLGFHSHFHQPLVKGMEEKILDDLKKDREIINQIGGKVLNHYALPSGVCTMKAKSILSKEFDYIYTINGSGYSKHDKVIDRISLISSNFSPLMNQIEMTCTLKYKVKKKIINFRNAYM